MEIFMKFVLPVLVFIGIGAIIGFCLAFLGEKLSVKRDPKIDDVVRHLSGANCGGCGYAGCAAFAEALVKGEAQLSACNPTDKNSKANISKILGMSQDESRATVAIVHCNGGNKCRDKYDYQGFGDCLSAELLAGGSKACSVGCMGKETCSNSCKYGAITINRDTGVSEVDSRLCTSCGACVSVCPKKIISRIPLNAKVFVACSNTWKGKEVMSICENGCIACGKCEKGCPVKAISLNNNLAIIDYDKCTGCGHCVEVCPRKCIHYFDAFKLDKKNEDKKNKEVITGEVKIPTDTKQV